MNTFNKYAMRRLYNINSSGDHAGRGEQGTVKRKEFKVTIRPMTYLALRNVIDVGPGQYGSSVVELCLRVILCLMGALDVEQVGEELVLATMDRRQLVMNLGRLASYINNYKPQSTVATDLYFQAGEKAI